MYSDLVEVNVGDVVHVSGVVDEFFGLTELTTVSSIDVCAIGASVVETNINLPPNKPINPIPPAIARW